MSVRYAIKRAIVIIAVTIVAICVLPSAAGAHSLTSSTISVRVHADGTDATVSLALETLDQALGSDYVSAGNLDDYADEVIAYLDEHLTVTGADGTPWAERYANAARTSVEGIESFSVDVAFDNGDADPGAFTLTYDAIIEVVPDHEAVVVLTDANGKVSTPGIIDASGGSVSIGSATADVAVSDMVRYGFHHVLEGADHLLFLATLLLPAPLAVVAGRWRPGGGALPALKKVAHVVTSFTIGHSLTLIGSALGWFSLPSRPVEIMIAASVGVAALHVIRPFTARGEAIIALAFGLVHGLAFAGILSDLGLERSTSLVALLAFNVGIEVAQLATTVAVFPALYLMSRTRFYPAFRTAGATVALAAAVGWALDRLGLVANPLAALEQAVIDNPWPVVTGLGAMSLAAWVVDRHPASSGGRERPRPDWYAPEPGGDAA